MNLAAAITRRHAFCISDERSDASVAGCCARALQAVRLAGRKPPVIRNVGIPIVIPWSVKRSPPVCNVRWQPSVDVHREMQDEA